MGMKQFGYIHGPITKVEKQTWGWTVTLDMDTYVRDRVSGQGEVKYESINISVPASLVKGKNPGKEADLLEKWEEDCVPGEVMYAEYELAVYQGAIQLKAARKPEVGIREYRGLSRARREALGIPVRGQSPSAPAAQPVASAAAGDEPPF